MSRQIDVVSFCTLPKRFCCQIDVHTSSQCVGDNERRRREVVRLNLWMNPRFEVPVAGEDRADHKISIVDRTRNRLGERAGIANACRAAVADDVEAKLVEIPVKPGLLVVVGDDLRPWREARFDPRLPFEARFYCLLGQDASPDHDARIRRIRTARNRGDDDRAMCKFICSAVGFNRYSLS